jgi:hypothetical protein
MRLVGWTGVWAPRASWDEGRWHTLGAPPIPLRSRAASGMGTHWGLPGAFMVIPPRGVSQGGIHGSFYPQPVPRIRLSP